MSGTKQVLVTGGAGFIGSHIVDRLVKEGYKVKVLDDLSTGNLLNIQTHVDSRAVEFIQGDIRDLVVVKKSVAGSDVVIHLAALISVPFSVAHPDLTFDVNLAGTLNVLRCSAQAGVEKFVFISSCAVYGEPEALPVDETVRVNPISPYAESKLIGERYCTGFSDRSMLNTIIFRFFNVYGCRQCVNDYSGVITKFIERMLGGESLVVYGDGSQTRDFINVSDIADAVVTSVKKQDVPSGVFNLGSGKPTSINTLASTLIDLAGAKVAVHHEEAREGDIQHSYADISKAQRLLGYEPQVSLSDGLGALLKEKLMVKKNDSTRQHQ
jgi:UDP-glucose 4-epimerase